MSKIKVNLKPLVGIDRKTTVFPSVDLMLRALDLSENVETVQTDNGDLESLKKIRKTFHEMLDYIQDFLKLSDAEMARFRKNNTPEKVGDVLGRIVMMLQGVAPEKIEQASKKQKLVRKAAEKDPKK